jgi:alpha-galactosidase
VWVAWQFDTPEQGTGVVQAFRRAGCPRPATMLKLRGLDPAARYSVRNVDEPAASVHTGRELMQGLRIALPEASAAIVEYTRIN